MKKLTGDWTQVRIEWKFSLPYTYSSPIWNLTHSALLLSSYMACINNEIGFGGRRTKSVWLVPGELCNRFLRRVARIQAKYDRAILWVKRISTSQVSYFTNWRTPYTALRWSSLKRLRNCSADNDPGCTEADKAGHLPPSLSWGKMSEHVSIMMN